MTQTLLAAAPTSGAEYAFIAAYFVFFAIFALIGIVFSIIVYWRIAAKAGYNGAWSLLMFVPFVNFVVMILFAFGEWPVTRALREATGSPLPPRGYVPPGGGGYAPAFSNPTNPSNPYANQYPAPTQPPPGYGVPPPPASSQHWPPDPPESM